MAELNFNNVSVLAGEKPLLQNASLRLSPAELTVIIGPNGAGKSTLLKTALGLVHPHEGQVRLNGANIQDVEPEERARLVSYLPQQRSLAWPILVEDVVALGRFAYGANMGPLSSADHDAIKHAIDACDLNTFLGRRTDTLSGGELARVHCARAIAAQTPLLLVDEPITALDLQHQLRLMSLLRQFADSGKGVVAVLHDLTLAGRFADRVICLNEGVIVADDTPAKVLTQQRLASVFKIKATTTQKEGKILLTIDGVVLDTHLPNCEIAHNLFRAAANRIDFDFPINPLNRVTAQVGSAAPNLHGLRSTKL